MKFEKRDNKYIFCKDDVYFALTVTQVLEIFKLSGGILAGIKMEQLKCDLAILTQRILLPLS